MPIGFRMAGKPDDLRFAQKAIAHSKDNNDP
jgi:hypothetical protein